MAARSVALSSRSSPAQAFLQSPQPAKRGVTAFPSESPTDLKPRRRIVVIIGIDDVTAK